MYELAIETTVTMFRKAVFSAKGMRLLIVLLFLCIMLQIFILIKLPVSNSLEHQFSIKTKWWNDISDEPGALDPHYIWQMLTMRKATDMETPSDPPGIITHRDQGLTHFKNACIFPFDFKQTLDTFPAPVRVFDSRYSEKPMWNYTHRFLTDVQLENESFWSVNIFPQEKLAEFRDQNVTRFENTVAYFPPYWRFNHKNMYLLFETIFRVTTRTKCEDLERSKDWPCQVQSSYGANQRKYL